MPDGWAGRCSLRNGLVWSHLPAAEAVAGGSGTWFALVAVLGGANPAEVGTEAQG